jgi:dTDP-4-amino-4,6-dideoxygalactose transaminase
MILFNDLARETHLLKDEINSAIQKVLDSGRYILGNELTTFETEFARYTDCGYCVGVASGTEAIALALMALKIGKGDEVITSNMTAFPTITGITQSGATAVTVDIIGSNGLIDPEKIRSKITKRTKAIVPVHLYGQSCNMNQIKQIAELFKLFVVEDCAQAAGASFEDKKCGSMGHCGAFSFYPTKNLGALGDGGAITTNDESVYKRLLALRNYGQTNRYQHETEGINSRLDEMQAAILKVKLKYLDQWNRQRNEIASHYRNHLQGVDCLTAETYGKTVDHLFVIQSEHRDQLMQYLLENGIQTLIHYPIPVNRQKAFKRQKNELLEKSEHFAKSILSLPIYPGLSKNDQNQIIHTINEFKP